MSTKVEAEGEKEEKLFEKFMSGIRTDAFRGPPPGPTAPSKRLNRGNIIEIFRIGEQIRFCTIWELGGSSSAQNTDSFQAFSGLGRSRRGFVFRQNICPGGWEFSQIFPPRPLGWGGGVFEAPVNRKLSMCV